MNVVRARLLGLLLAALVTLAPAALALAQDDDPGQSRAATFEAAQGARTEEIPGGALMVGAYGVVWILVLGYVVWLGFKQSGTARELERLRQDLDTARARGER